MFTMELAGVLIGVENHYPDMRHLCRPFLRETEQAIAFTVSATEQECRQESVLPGYGEILCLCRKICRELLWHDVLLLHAAAIEMDGRGYLFAGKSGAGKTTHINLWQQVFGSRVTVINGDKPLISFAGERPVVHGSPWRGKDRQGNAGSAPLKALCFVEKSTENRLETISAEAAMERIFDQILLPGDAGAMEKSMELVEKLLMQLPCYVMHCRMDAQAATTAYEGLKEAP